MTEFTERYLKALDLHQTVDVERIADCLMRWTHNRIPLRLVTTSEEVVKASQENDNFRRRMNEPYNTHVVLNHLGVYTGEDVYEFQFNDLTLTLQNEWANYRVGQAWDLGNAWNRQIMGRSFDIGWLTAILASAEAAKDWRHMYEWMPLFEAFEAGAWLLFLTEEALVVATIPTLQTDAQGRLHSDHDAAFQWLDVERFFWHGERVLAHDSWVITHPENITLDDIINREDVFLSNLMIERYTFERMYQEKALSKWGRSDRYGTLYYLFMNRTRENVWVVRVKNSTPELNGSYAHHFIRVPPWVNTPKEAVAWTFGYEDASEYQPEKES